MCTAVAYAAKDHYFGRNLDLEISYRETVTVTPRNYPLQFRKAPRLDSHYAMIGMATVIGGYPLYYDATNEKGLSMAGLNFPGNADYKPEAPDQDNITPFEFIPWILGQCADLKEARRLLANLNLVQIPFSPEFPLTPLHWILSDREGSLTVESVKDGLKVHENPVGVLTNNPPFDMQLFTLNNYRNLSPDQPQNRFSDTLDLSLYSRGMGAMGMPGDASSSSRFVRAVFTKLNSPASDDEAESVGQFFHILGAVEMPKGCVRVENGKFEYTLYSSCCNVDRGIYYYITYGNRRITAVDMHRENLEGSEVICYELRKEQDICFSN